MMKVGFTLEDVQTAVRALRKRGGGVTNDSLLAELQCAVPQGSKAWLRIVLDRQNVHKWVRDECPGLELRQTVVGFEFVQVRVSSGDRGGNAAPAPAVPAPAPAAAGREEEAGLGFADSLSALQCAGDETNSIDTCTSSQAMGVEACGAEERSYRLAQAAVAVLKLEYSDLAYPMALKGLEESGGIERASASVKGVSLARNVVAKSSLDLAEQHLAAYKVAALETLEPNWAEGLAAAGNALAYAMQSALSFDAQLGDWYLESTHAAELRRLCDSRDKAVTLREEARVAVEVASEGAASADAERRLLEEQSRDFNGDALAVGGGSSERSRSGAAAAAAAAQEAVRARKRAEELRMEQQRRMSSIQELLKEGGWALQRSSNHNVYARRVIKHSDRGPAVEKQSFTLSKTPSDTRAHANALTQLRRCDDGVSHVLSDLDLDGSATAELTEILDKIHITQNDLDRIKEQTRIVDDEKERIEMLLASYQSRRYAIEFGIEWEQC